ncbi:MAG: glycosyltransferase, partial [Candidatus Krumholzibacteria bacterium]|nr:glycosyltransferase [Candidatus Krumholzibacteria bacterium]
FPVLRETFIAREIIELERRGIRVKVVALRSDAQETGAREKPAAEVLYPPFLSPAVLVDAFVEFARHPLSVLKSIFYIVFRLIRKPVRAVKFVALLPKILHLCRIFRRQNVFHIHAHWATVPTTCALFISRVTGIPFSFTAHAWDIHVRGNEYLLIEKIEAAKRVFTCTSYNRQRLIEMGSADKIELMYHGIEMDRYRFCEDKPEGLPLVLAGGSLTSQKGLADLVEALGLLNQQGVTFRAVIFGEGPERDDLERRIRSTGLSGSIKLIGTCHHDRVIELMQRAMVFVMPSKRAPGGFIDGLPNVVAEAMACGACVVASRFSGIPELVNDGENGILVEPGDRQAFATAIGSVLSGDDFRPRYIRNARKKVERMF